LSELTGFNMSLDHKELLEKSPLAIVISDIQDRITWCNQALLDALKMEQSDVVGRLYPALPLEAVDRDTHLVQLFSDECKDEVRFHYWQNNLDSPEGSKVHYFTQERIEKKRFNLAAAKLDKGQLPKRANWVEFLSYEVSRSRRYNNPLSILKLHLLILEKPDSVADGTLHQTIKDTLMDELRWADMIGHTDHGTYLLVLPETPQDALDALEAKLHKALQKKIDFISEKIVYKLVFGKASWEKHNDSQILLKRAREDLVTKLESLLSD